MFKLGSRVTPIHDTDDWYGTRPDRIKDARRVLAEPKKVQVLLPQQNKNVHALFVYMCTKCTQVSFRRPLGSS